MIHWQKLNEPKGEEMRVFIVEDSEVVRERLITMLSEIKGVEIVGEAENTVEAIKAIREQRPIVVILDLRLTAGNGIEVLKGLRQEQIPAMVIVLTNYPYPQYRKRCMDLGADYFFDKSTGFEKVSQVLKQLIRNS